MAPERDGGASARAEEESGGAAGPGATDPAVEELDAEDVVYVIDWDPDSAENLAQTLRAEGWPVRLHGDDAFDCVTASNCVPLAAIVSLDIDPERGCNLACQLVRAGATSKTPIIFIGGVPPSRDLARSLLGEAVFSERDGLAGLLRDLKGRR